MTKNSKTDQKRGFQNVTPLAFENHKTHVNALSRVLGVLEEEIRTANQFMELSMVDLSDRFQNLAKNLSDSSAETASQIEAQQNDIVENLSAESFLNTLKKEEQVSISSQELLAFLMHYKNLSQSLKMRQDNDRDNLKQVMQLISSIQFQDRMTQKLTQIQEVMLLLDDRLGHIDNSAENEIHVSEAEIYQDLIASIKLTEMKHRFTARLMNGSEENAEQKSKPDALIHVNLVEDDDDDFELF